MRFDIKFQERFNKLLYIDKSPHQIATASAVGMLIGLSPYVGLHTVLAIAISYVFKLPIYPLILGAYITNPFTVVIIYAFCYKLGVIITGVHFHMDISWSEMTFSNLMANMKGLFWPLFVGCHTLGAIFAVFTYFFIFYLVKKYREGA